MKLSIVALLVAQTLGTSAVAQVGGVTLTGPQTVQLTQSALVVLGHDPGPVDGQMGPMTRAAVTAFVEASGLEMGWNGQVIDQGQAMSLNVAAAPALMELVGHNPHGSYVQIAVVPYAETEDLLAGRISFLNELEDVNCADRPDAVAQIDGLIVFEPGRDATVVQWDDGAFAPLPRSGIWHPEAEPWRLVILSDDAFALQQEGDNYVYGRCVP